MNAEMRADREEFVLLVVARSRPAFGAKVNPSFPLRMKVCSKISHVVRHRQRFQIFPAIAQPKLVA